MEALGPKVTLKPGEETKLKTSWEVYKGGLESVPLGANWEIKKESIKVNDEIIEKLKDLGYIP
jgi:hypothetical protein